MQQQTKIVDLIKKSHGGKASGGNGGVVRPKDTVDWHAELIRFYKGINMPNKLTDLDNIMASWEGKEDLMLESLIQKYKNQIPKELNLHLQKLLDYVHHGIRHKNTNEKEYNNNEDDGDDNRNSEYNDN